jgi:uncharacterized protein YbjT (DUF2867 family)
VRIAITAPTGNVGRELVPMLVRGGLRPRGLLRDLRRLPTELRDRVDPVQLDLLDADAVVAATADVDALYWVAPPTMSDDPRGKEGESVQWARCQRPPESPGIFTRAVGDPARSWPQRPFG